MNTSKMKSYFYTNEVITYLKFLGYEFESWDKEWVYSVLVSSCPTRYNLLNWILQQMGFKTHCITGSSSEQLNQILEDLSFVGFCKLSDSDLIEATASPVLQLKFWKKLLEFVVKLKCQPGHDVICAGSDQLLDNLLHFPYYHSTLKIFNSPVQIVTCDDIPVKN